VEPVNDPPLATEVSIEPVSPDNMDDLTSSYVWYDNVEADDTEEGSIITWYKSTDGGVNYGKVEEFDNEITVPHTATNWGEWWYFTVTPGDNNGGLGTEVASNLVFIIRIIPEIYFHDVTIEGEPTERGELTVELVDSQGDTSQTQYQWFRNNEPIDGATLPTLTSHYFDEGDTITVSATPFDGFNEGDPVMSSKGVVIVNSPPSIDSVIITPQNPNAGDDLWAMPVGYSDPDEGDYRSYMDNENYYHVFFVYDWTVNGEEIDGVTGETLENTFFDQDDIVRVTVTPSDGENYGEPVVSENITIEAIPQDEDYDLDGVPNDVDLDDDNDGHPDINDAFPFDEDEWRDYDNDGKGDNADSDDDNDGFPDGFDFAPRNSSVQLQPWIWLGIFILIVLLILFAYFKWWYIPKQPKASSELPSEEDLSQEDSGESITEEDLSQEDSGESVSEDLEDTEGKSDEEYPSIDEEIDYLTDDKPEIPEPPTEEEIAELDKDTE
jgi:hypothetical protein